MPILPNPHRYLPDADGLRAIAVLALVLFHLETPGFSGGFVGIDIFFVISGFLLSAILLDHVDRGTLNVAVFYGSRILRLLPALLATVAVTAIAALVLSSPLALQDFGRSALATIFGVANIVAYAESQQIANGVVKPLKHMWSLGIGAQFYVLWPLLLWLLTQYMARRGLLISLSLILGLSLAASVLYTDANQPAAFFLLPFRLWQFCLGALTLILWRSQVLAVFTQQLLRSAGLALCCVAIVSFADISHFPGWQALVPSVGAAMVLLGASPDDPSPVLGNRPARWLGSISYSMYLVHWPAMTLYLAVVHDVITDATRLSLAVLILVCTLSLHYGVTCRRYRLEAPHTDCWNAAARRTLVLSLLMGVSMAALWLYPISE